MVLPMSFSPSQSPPSILHFLHAAETTAASSDGSRGTAMDSGPAVALGLGLKRRTGPGGRGSSQPDLSWPLPETFSSSPICQPELGRGKLRRWETGQKLVFCRGPEWVRTCCLLVLVANHFPACVRPPSSVWQERTDSTDCLLFTCFSRVQAFLPSK